MFFIGTDYKHCTYYGVVALRKSGDIYLNCKHNQDMGIWVPVQHQNAFSHQRNHHFSSKLKKHKWVILAIIIRVIRAIRNPQWY